MPLPPFVHPPLSGTVLQQRGEKELTTFEWPRAKFFSRLSMNSALIEAQTNTYLLGGSNAYMTSRDWNRFGLLYERDGIWVDGTRFFADGWVAATGTPSAVNGGYDDFRRDVGREFRISGGIPDFGRDVGRDSGQGWGGARPSWVWRGAGGERALSGGWDRCILARFDPS